MQIFRKIANWYLKRCFEADKKKQEKARLTQTEARRKYFHKQMQELYKFVKWLNTKGIKNRTQRKMFWKSVKNGQPIVEDAIKQIIKKYEKPIDPKKAPVQEAKLKVNKQKTPVQKKREEMFKPKKDK